LKLSYSKFRFSLLEFAGSLGDLGTLLPLLVGLIVFNGISAGSAITLIGLSYIVTGVYYRIPIPVQPLKAAAMIAIATGATLSQVRAAALWMAAITLILAATRLADKLNSVFPRVLVHGLQAGLGLMMIRSGLKFVASYPKCLGVVVSGVNASPSHVGPIPLTADFASALLLLVLPQIPLTIGNSVIATRDCAIRYFGPAGERATASRLSATIGIGNLAAGLFGGMPMCHGAGGMTAHYHFGARTGASGVMIGSLFVILGLGAGRWVPGLLPAIPAWALGAPLAYAGVRHVMLARKSFESLAEAAVVVGMAAATLLGSSLLVALGIGLMTKIVIHGYLALRLRWV
jgi:SulP family sulfate permease